MSRIAVLGALLSSVLLVTSSGCTHGSSVTVGQGEPTTSHAGRGHGPPPHAPAHGYRHKQHHRVGDIELVFHSGLGVYVVVGVPDHYYWNGYYLRIEKGRWYASVDLDGDWQARSSDSLPPGLRKKYARHKGRKKGYGPAKGAW